jgi:hypothetical protein
MRFAASVPATAHRAVDPLTTPKADPPHIVRWCTDDLCHDCWFATLLTTHDDSTVVLEAGEEAPATARIDRAGGPLKLELDTSLNLIGESDHSQTWA